MFKRLLELLKKEDLLHQAVKDAIEMLKLAKKIYQDAMAPFAEGGEIDPQQVYEVDQKINQYEIEIRRKILEHLSVSPQQDTTAALVLTTITVDIERLGDYSKNFVELWELYNAPLKENEYLNRLLEVHRRILQMYDDTLEAFSEGDAEKGKQVMETHIINSKDCEEVIAALIRTPGSCGMSPNQEVLIALTARYLKRISAHLKNIASSVVNPFDRIGYKPVDRT